MGHYAYLNGCRSRDAASRYPTDDVLSDRAPELVAKSLIPLFWLAGFESADVLTVRHDADEWLVLCAATSAVTARLARRRKSIMALLPAAFRRCYDDWIRYLETGYPDHMLLRTDDLFSMDGFERSGLRLRAALRWLEDADKGAKLRETDALDWFASFSGAFHERHFEESPVDVAMRWRAHLTGVSGTEGKYAWPTPPTPDEIAYAATVPTASSRDGLQADENLGLSRAIREGVHPDTVSGQLTLALAKLAGAVPLGADAPSKGLRKAIGSGAALLSVVRGVFLALVGIPLGGAMLYFGCCDTRNWRVVGIGAALVLLGAWAARSGWRAARDLRTIRRA